MDGLSDAPSAPPIHDHSQEDSPAPHCDTRTCATISVTEGSTVKKQEHGDSIAVANLPEKTDMYLL